MIRHLLGFVAFSLALPASAQTIEVGRGDWSDIPELKTTRDVTLTGSALDVIDKEVKKGRCAAITGRGNVVRMNVPFLVEFTPQGGISRLVVRNIGCPAVESVLAGAALAMVKTGASRSTGENEARWYRSKIEYYTE